MTRGTSRISFKRVKEGSGEGGSKFTPVVEKFEFDSRQEEQKFSIIIPSDNDEPVIFELPYHELNRKANKQALQRVNKKGEKYTPFEFACINHVVMRPGPLKDELKALKEETGCTCPLCEIQRAETRKFYKQLEENHPNFSEYSSDDKRKVYKDFDENERSVGASFEFTKDGKFIPKVKRRLIIAVVDAQGGYKLNYIDVSDKRLRLIRTAIADAIESGSYPEENVKSYTNLDGELEYDFTNIELIFRFPKGEKMYAGKEMGVTVVAERRSRTANDEELVNKINADLQSKLDSITNQMDNDFNLQYIDRDEMMNFINQDYYNELMENYPYVEKGADTDAEEVEDTKPARKRASKKAEKVESVEDLFE